MKLAPVAALLVGCTTLGPMPATTGISAIPAGRPGGEISASVTPLFRLSDAARGAERNGNAIPQLGALFDPDRLLGIPGLIVAGRVWGEHGDTGVEPQLGYRQKLDDIAIAGIVYGTKMKDDENGASYKATRFGGEAAIDAKLAGFGTWTALYVHGAAAATYIKASGRYCYDSSNGNGRDCAEDGSIPMIDGALSGVFPSATIGIALDVGHKPTGGFHSARLAVMLAGGWMPRIVNGDQTSGDAYISGGVGLTIGFGAAE